MVVNRKKVAVSVAAPPLHPENRKNCIEALFMSAPHRFYMTQTWRQLRRFVLRDHPICQHCHRAASQHVDHVQPHRGDWDRFTDPANLRALCAGCHSAKTAAKDRGFGNRGTGRPLKGTGPTGLPTDPDHPWNKD